jgi:hypothetical protein
MTLIIKLLNILLNTINITRNIVNRLNNSHFTLKITLTLISLLLLISFISLKSLFYIWSTKAFNIKPDNSFKILV